MKVIRFGSEKNLIAFTSKTGPVLYCSASLTKPIHQSVCWVCTQHTSDSGNGSTKSLVHINCCSVNSSWLRIMSGQMRQSMCCHRTFATDCSKACETWPRASSAQSSDSGRLATWSAVSLQYKQDSHRNWSRNDLFLDECTETMHYDKHWTKLQVMMTSLHLQQTKLTLASTYNTIQKMQQYVPLKNIFNTSDKLVSPLLNTMLITRSVQQQQLPFYGPLSGTTRWVSTRRNIHMPSSGVFWCKGGW